MKFVRKNLNPTKSKTSGDCVVRAIMYAQKKTWDEVYIALCDLGFSLKKMPNTKQTYETYLANNGWLKQPMPRFPDNTRYTLKEFADSHRGTFIVSVANHLTIVSGGKLIDSWDCSYKSVGNYWKKS